MIRSLLLVALLAAPAMGQGWTTGPYSATPITKLVSVERAEAASHAERRRQLQRNENGTFWKFAPEQPHQAAAVRVQCLTPEYDAQGNRFHKGGSGTLVATNGSITLMVTNHHVVEQGDKCDPSVRVFLRDGRQLQAQHMIATPREDVAVYRIDRTDLPTVAVSSENAPAGATIEVMGFGGPRHRPDAFRPYIAKTVPTNLALAVDAPAISGDSGSGMIWQHVLVGVNWGADSTPTQSAGVAGDEGVPLVYPATSSADAMFLNRFLTQACGPYGCQPIIGNPGYLPGGGQQYGGPPQGGQQFPGPEQFYRPPGGGQPQTPPDQGGGLTPPVSDPVSPQQPTQPQGCDCEPCPPGEPGPKGDKGEKGEPGEPGAPGTVTDEHLAAVVATISAQLKADPEMRGPQGERGEPGKDAEIDLDALAAAVAGKLPPVRVVIADGAKRKIIEDEDYNVAGGEPIVLDIQTIVDAAKAK